MRASSALATLSRITGRRYRYPTQPVPDDLSEIAERLVQIAARLRAGELDPESALELIEECARMASEASAKVDQYARAALEPLPDLPGQLPLPAA
jgi:hypothetical protein